MNNISHDMSGHIDQNIASVRGHMYQRHINVLYT